MLKITVSRLVLLFLLGPQLAKPMHATRPDQAVLDNLRAFRTVLSLSGEE